MVKKLLDLPLSSRKKIVPFYVWGGKKKSGKVKQHLSYGTKKAGNFLMYWFGSTCLFLVLGSREGIFIRKLWLFAVGL